MNTFGSREVARDLFEWTIANERDKDMERAPEGFYFLGAGCYRYAYLHTESDLVYKVGTYSENIKESANARRLIRRSTRQLGFDLHIPRTRTYRMRSTMHEFYGYNMPNCVVVQEYAPDAQFTECDAIDDWMDITPPCSCNNSPCYADVLREITRWSRLDDIHYGNVLVDNAGRFWIVDLAC